MMIDRCNQHLLDWPADPTPKVTPASFSIMIDWLSVVRDPTDRHRLGTLICQDDRGYVCNIGGEIRTFDPLLVRIQTIQNGPYNLASNPWSR